jgi:hypothetical protein
LLQDKFKSRTFYILPNFHSSAKTIELQLGREKKSAFFKCKMCFPGKEKEDTFVKLKICKKLPGGTS